MKQILNLIIKKVDNEIMKVYHIGAEVNMQLKNVICNFGGDINSYYSIFLDEEKTKKFITV